jgi:HEPN domain-containing protein
MSDQTDLARSWLRKSYSDLAAARRILSGEGPYDTTCFHSQQATEKTFKALLAYRGQPIPRAHNLEELARLCQQLEPIPELRL